jgi:hypothetical protein
MEELDRILAVILCAAGLHNWTKWSDPKQHLATPEEMGQDRYCLRCGRLDWHSLYRTGKCDPHKWELFKQFNLVHEDGGIPYATQYVHKCSTCGEMKEQKF